MLNIGDTVNPYTLDILPLGAKIKNTFTGVELVCDIEGTDDDYSRWSSDSGYAAHAWQIEPSDFVVSYFPLPQGIILSEDGNLLNWNGINYIKQHELVTDIKDPRLLPGALVEVTINADEETSTTYRGRIDGETGWRIQYVLGHIETDSSQVRLVEESHTDPRLDKVYEWAEKNNYRPTTRQIKELLDTLDKD